VSETSSATQSLQDRNLQVVRQMFQAFHDGDVPGILAQVDDSVEWWVSGPAEVPYAGLRRGPDQVSEFFHLLSQVVEFERFQVDELIAGGESVMALGTSREHVKATGRAADNVWAMVFTLQDGKVRRFRSYEDTLAVAAAFDRA
jgi:ketosteroid isomerase-like protein